MNQRDFNFSTLIIVLTVSLLSQSCGGSNNNNFEVVTETYRYQQPALTADGWDVAHVGDLGIDPTSLEDMMNHIRQNRDGYKFIDAVVIVKDNKLILDERIRTQLDFADGWAGNKNIDLHVLNSVTKSFTSALIGIAIEQGLISSVDVKVHDYFQHKQPIANWTAAKADISLKNWLTMRHGYEWDESNVNYLDEFNLNAQMNNAPDPMQFLLDRPMATEPGNTFAYSTGVSFGLGRILQIASGQNVSDFMLQHLFVPLGIEQYDYWALDDQVHTGSSLYLSSRDMAKFGQLFLNKGNWNGFQVVSESWVEQSTLTHVINQNSGYGYQWWTRQFNVNGAELDCYYAVGFGGQYIYVFPAINAVVVFNGRAYADGQRVQYRPLDILNQDILPLLL